MAECKELDDTGVIAGRLSPGMMLTDFITKTPNGHQSEVNILANKTETVVRFIVPKY